MVLIVDENGNAKQVGALSDKDEKEIADGSIMAFFFDGSEFRQRYGANWFTIPIKSDAKIIKAGAV